MEIVIGKVIHYYPKVGVAALVLEDRLAKGDMIHIHGTHEDFRQTVTSMEIEHEPVAEATKGQDVGIKVVQTVHVGDVVFRET